MLNDTTVKSRLIGAAISLAKVRPWRELTLTDIAEAAGASLADVKAHFSSKTDILTAFADAIDEEMLRKAPKRAAAQSSRDALFEVMMSRFDALEPHKAALRSIVADAGPDLDLVRAALTTQRWILQAAGIDAGGPDGAVRTLGLATVYASVFRTWLDDDDPGLSRTMAALDRRLRRGEQNIRLLDDIFGAARRVCDLVALPGRRRAPKTPAAPAAAAPAGDAAPGSA